MPLAVYGILKAGAAYVPIDPAASADRLKYIIQHCGIRASPENVTIEHYLSIRIIAEYIESRATTEVVTQD